MNVDDDLDSYVFCSHTGAPGGGELALARYLTISSLSRKRLFTLAGGDVWDRVRAADVEVDVFESRVPLLRIARFRRAVRAQPGSVFVANSMKIALILALCLKRDQRLVYWLRDGLNNSGSSRVGVWLTKHVTLKRCTGIIANSRWTKSELPNRVAPDSVAVAYSPAGVERYLEHIGPVDAQDRETHDGALRTLRVLYLGRLAEWKGPHVAVEAIQVLNARGANVKLDIAGSALFGEDAYATRLKQLVQDAESVSLLGHVNDPVSILGNYDAVVHCSLRPEPFGQVVVQALAAGRVVFATNHGGPVEVIRSGHNGVLVSPGSPLELADAIQRVFGAGGIAAEMSRNARVSAAEFRDDVLVDRLDHCFESAAKRGGVYARMSSGCESGPSSGSVAIVHDYLTQRGGAEKVVLALARAFPDAPIYTTLYNPDATYPEFRDLDVRTTFLNRFRVFREDHRLSLPLLPFAIATIRPTESDLIVSSSGWAHGVRRRGGLKVVYCYSPARWLYQRDVYLGMDASRLERVAIAALSVPLKIWDRRQARTADQYLAISSVVRDRIAQCYRLEARVIAAPQTLASSAVASTPELGWSQESIEPGFYLCVSRLLPYKNVDKIIGAFNADPRRRLVVLGNGPERASLRELAGTNVTFVQDLSDAEVRWLYSNCRAVVASSFEDFGLSPLEGAVFGKPSAVLRWGGFLDTVVENTTGVFFDNPVPSAIADALDRVESQPWESDLIRNHALSFSEASFARAIREVLGLGEQSLSVSTSDADNPFGGV